MDVDFDDPVPLPGRVAEWLVELRAPARLEAHLRLVHQAANEVLEGLESRWPSLRIDRAAVLFGAATHDIGKAVHRSELGGPGSEHEEAGRALLEQRGVEPRLARFAVSHAAWKRAVALDLEDLLVALADNCWKGARPEVLENLVCTSLSAQLGIERWAVFTELDELVAVIAAGADERLEWQSRHPV